MNTKKDQLNLEGHEVVVHKAGCFSGKVNTFNKDLTGQVIIITGSNQGIGKETARGLAKTGATIILACRDLKKASDAVNEIRTSSNNKNVEFMELNLSDLKSIKEFADEFKRRYNRLDILINNAGITAPKRTLTKDGFELTIATNYLGPFFLTNLLTDVLKQSSPSRVLNLSSALHKFAKISWSDLSLEKNYSMGSSYNQSKLTINLWTKELQKRLKSSNIKVVSISPGLVKTEINAAKDDSKWWERFLSRIAHNLGGTPEEGARTSLYCALEDHEKLVEGAYYQDSKIAKEGSVALKEEDWARLWDVSERLIASKIVN